MDVTTYKEILDYLAEVIAGTEWAGRVYAVGGCCRDSVMGHEIKDIDLAVEVPDGGTKFSEWLVEQNLTTGNTRFYPMFSTAMLHLAKFPEHEIEVVQTRSGKYTEENFDNPERAFGDIVQDCMLRDLTINSLCYNVSTGEALDLTGKGLEDIEAHRLRTPVDPNITYSDDPLRILRAIRFSLKLGWELSPEMIASFSRYSANLHIISPRRLGAEVIKILTAPNPSHGLELMAKTGALKKVLGELTPIMRIEWATGNDLTVWNHTLRVIDAVGPDMVLRLAALFHEAGKPKVRSITRRGEVVYNGHEGASARMAHRWMRFHHLDNEPTEAVKYIIRNYHKMCNLQKVDEKRLLEIASEAGSGRNLDLLVQFAKAVNTANSNENLNELIDSRITELLENDKVKFVEKPKPTEQKRQRSPRGGRKDHHVRRKRKPTVDGSESKPKPRPKRRRRGKK